MENVIVSQNLAWCLVALSLVPYNGLKSKCDSGRGGEEEGKRRLKSINEQNSWHKTTRYISVGGCTVHLNLLGCLTHEPFFNAIFLNFWQLT